MFGPASGPRGYLNCGFEHEFESIYFNRGVSSEKWLCGASFAALRFVALLATISSRESKRSTCSNRLNYTDELIREFADMRYREGDTAETLKPMMERIFQLITPTRLLSKMLNHPSVHLVIFVAALKPHHRHYSDTRLKGLLVYLAARRAVQEAGLHSVVEQLCFYTGPNPPDFLHCHTSKRLNRRIRFVRLTQDNIHQVLHATTCIPFVQERCEYIEGVGHGLFMDGAIASFMLNVELAEIEKPAILLGDLPNGKVYPTAFDYYFPWRKPPVSYFRNCSVVCPTPQFVEALPDKNAPTVRDWFKKEYIDRPELRIQKWALAYRLSVVSLVSQIAHELTFCRRTFLENGK